MTCRSLLIVMLAPVWVVLASISAVVGLAVFSGADPAAVLAPAFYSGGAEMEQLSVLLARVVLLPFQLIFIAMVGGAALWVFRRRGRIAGWVLGEPLAERLFARDQMPAEASAVLPAGRRHTMHQILSSVVALSAILLAALLIMGQFIGRADLAVVVAALTSSLAWGARLPVGDLLGGLGNMFESNLAVGDHIRYRQFDRSVDGLVESVDLRFLSVRARTGELTSIPFGELRIFRNYSRGQFLGVYIAVPIAAADLSRAVTLLNELAPHSVALVPYLMEPWQPMSLEGEMGAILDLYLFGKTTQEWEDELQLAMHTVVHERFAAAGIRLAGQGNDA
ncbi:MAG: mechanosensitive ion channel family protein [Candidatus Promineofilum sp.]|nr:mechanosensitive ion channel family protein [Promineifilum sp.]